MKLLWVCALAAVLMACSSSPGTGVGSPTPAGSSPTPTGITPTPTGGASTPSSTNPPGITPTATPGGATTPTPTPSSSTIAYCAKSCNKVAECVPSPSTPLTDADNWSCTEGVCLGTGCNTTSECTQTYGTTGYACEPLSYLGVTGDARTCVKTCNKAADCATTLPSMDKDNYSCDKGICQYLGCNGNKECTVAGQVCQKPKGYNVPYCVPGCSTAANCATSLPAYDRDNYACTDGVCEYTGCNSSQECLQSSSPAYPLNECHGL